MTGSRCPHGFLPPLCSTCHGKPERKSHRAKPKGRGVLDSRGRRRHSGLVDMVGQRIGRLLVAAALDDARRLGVPRVFALTLEPEFFERLGFDTIRREDLPMKVWSDCARCPKQQECDEIAVAKTVMDEPRAATEAASTDLSLLE